MSDAVAVIEVRNLSRVYSTGSIEVHALRNINVRIIAGEFVAIMGASGSGKSTFMNIVGCLDLPNSGEILIDGVDVRSMSRNTLAHLRNTKLGFIFQSFNILSRTSAQENVELPLLYSSEVSTVERRQRATECLRSVGLAERADAFPNQLSGGQQQRVAIARALVNRPLVILADEPTGNLDSRTSYEIMEIFQDLHSKGITIVMVTHEPDIAAFATRNIVFHDGKIQSDKLVPIPHNAAAELKALPMDSPIEVES